MHLLNNLCDNRSDEPLHQTIANMSSLHRAISLRAISLKALSIQATRLRTIRLRTTFLRTPANRVTNRTTLSLSTRMTLLRRYRNIFSLPARVKTICGRQEPGITRRRVTTGFRERGLSPRSSGLFGLRPIGVLRTRAIAATMDIGERTLAITAASTMAMDMWGVASTAGIGTAIHSPTTALSRT